MRWSRSARVRTVARRGAGVALAVLGLGFVLVLGWSGTGPREVVPPEGGGPAWQVSTVAGTGNERLTGTGTERLTGTAEDPGQHSRSGRRGAAAELSASEVHEAAPVAAKPVNPLNELVDGPAFSRFLGFTAISVGFAVVVLVFFWSHRRNPYA